MQRTGRLVLLVAGLVAALRPAAVAADEVPAVPVAAPATRTVVSISFDDGARDQYPALAILRAHALHATFYVNTGLIGDARHLSWAQLAEIHAAGNEIGGHGLTHVNLTRLSPAALRRQVCDDRAALAAHGFDPVSFAYPYGIASAEVARVVADCGYRSGRTASGLKEKLALVETIPPLDPFALRVRPSVKRHKGLRWIEDAVTAAERRGGGWVQLVFHRLCDDDCDLYSISPADFAALLDWLAPRAARGTVVRTVAEVTGDGAP